MPKKIYKELIEYICNNCLKNFGNKKGNYKTHINRKYPCKKTAPEITLITPEIAPNKLICIKTSEKKYCCEFCKKNFVRKYGLERHLKCRCKLKQEKGGINNKLLEIDNKLNLILKQNEELKDENKKLKKQIKKTKNKSHITINQPNINIKMINNIVNFNDIDYNNIDKKLFISPILDRRLFGKAIILKMIENIYINENLPEYQNLMITDKNRGYVKIYNNGKWKTDNINIINLVLNEIVEHSKIIVDELYEIYLNNNNVKNRINSSEKYLNYCDLEHLQKLKDEQTNDDANNKHDIKRCEEFRDMVFKDTINLFHDNKNILLKTKKNNKIIEL